MFQRWSGSHRDLHRSGHADASNAAEGIEGASGRIRDRQKNEGGPSHHGTERGKGAYPNTSGQIGGGGRLTNHFEINFDRGL